MLGKIIAFNRFISPYDDKCRSMVKLLMKQGAELEKARAKKGEKKMKDEKAFERVKSTWNPKCQKAFE